MCCNEVFFLCSKNYIILRYVTFYLADVIICYLLLSQLLKCDNYLIEPWADIQFCNSLIRSSVMGLDFWVLKLNYISRFLIFFVVKKEEELKRSLEEKNSQIYIHRSQVSWPYDLGKIGQIY